MPPSTPARRCRIMDFGRPPTLARKNQSTSPLGRKGQSPGSDLFIGAGLLRRIALIADMTHANHILRVNPPARYA